MNETFLKDPAQNYTVGEQSYGARVPEFVVRQLLGYALRRIAENADQPNSLIDQLFRMHGSEVVSQLKGYLRTHPNVQCVVNWPAEDIHMPFLAVVNKMEQEDETFVFLGDRVGSARYKQPNSAVTQFATGINCTLEIYVASTDANLTIYLAHLVRFILLSNKDKLSEIYDIHNMRISAQDLQFEEKFFPTFGYFKVIELRFLTMFDFAVSDEAINIVNLEGLLVENAGVTVTVPSDTE